MMTQDYENKMVKTKEIKDKDGKVIGLITKPGLSKETIEALKNFVPSDFNSETDKKEDDENC